jgi:hypothetical protein
MIITPPSNIWVPRNKGRAPVQDFNTIDLEDSDTVNQAKLESWIAQQVGEVLEFEYPGREWGVRVNIPGGMVEVFCMALSGTHAYHILLEGRSMKDLQKRAKMAGGEILERFGVTRGKKYDVDTTETFKRDVKGDAIVDGSND